MRSFWKLAALSALALLAPAMPVALAESITVYNAQHASLTQAWSEGFTKETGIEVVLRKGGDMELANQLLLEGRDSPADVFLTENSPAMVLVDRAGLLAPLDAATLAQVPESRRPAHGRWTGIAARSTVFAYDREKLRPDQLPASLLDLADPAWSGRWGAAPAGADFQAIVGALLALEGEDVTARWLQALKTGAIAYRGNSVAMKAVNNGEIEGALIYHYYYFGDRANTGENSDRVALHYFRHQDPGAFVSLSGGGVLATSKDMAAAQRFLGWITGPGGQAILKDGKSFEYAVGRDAASNPALVPLADLDPPPVDPADLDSRKVTELMRAAGIL